MPLINKHYLNRKRIKNAKDIKSVSSSSPEGREMLGEGTYGCVFYPALYTLNQRDDHMWDGYVSKVFADVVEPFEEISEIKQIHKMDPTYKWHLKSSQVLYMDSNNRENLNELNECSLIDEYTLNEIKQKRRRTPIIQYENGGEDIERYLKQSAHRSSLKSNMMRVLNELSTLTLGVQEMAKHKYVHLDIKEQNIVYNNMKHRYNFIDFGLGTTMDSFIKDRDMLILSNYYAYPLDIQFIEPEFRPAKISKAKISKIKRKFETNILTSHMLFMDNKYSTELYSKSALPSVIEDNLKYINENTTKSASKTEVAAIILPKIDVFSLGAVLTRYYMEFSGNKFSYDGSIVTSDYNMIFEYDKTLDTRQNIIQHFRRMITMMCNPFIRYRIPSNEVHDVFMKMISSLTTKSASSSSHITIPKSVKKSIKNMKNMKTHKTPLKKTAKECPDGKILNPSTNRCVNINGAIGKKIANLNKHKTHKTHKIHKTHKKTHHKTSKVCRINPSTKRCSLHGTGDASKCMYNTTTKRCNIKK